MTRTRWIQATMAVLLLVAALAFAQNRQRPGGQRPAPPPQTQTQAKPPSSAPARGTPPASRGGQADRGTPPAGQRSAHPRQAESRPRSPRGERPRARSQDRPYGRPDAPDSPPYQRVYPVPGIHDHPTPRVFIPSRHYPRPYYEFRAQYRLGFGLYMGYPLAYPLIYGYPSYVYDGGEIVLLPSLPSAGLYGGISFDVTPDDAIVFVDGVDVGTACDFAPTEQPLTLRPGRHRIEMHARGMLPLAFDVVIRAGEVVPFSGTLQPR